MKKAIKIGIIIVIILIIITVALIMINKYKKKENNILDKQDEFEVKANNQISEVTFDNEIMNIKECIQKYINYFYEEDYNAIYEILENNYKNINNITVNNINNSVKNIYGQFILDKLEKREININLAVYYAYGNITYENYTVDEEQRYTIIVDYAKSKFYLIPEILEDEYDYQNNNKDDTNVYSEFNYKNYSDEEILKDQFNYYKYLILNKQQKAFEMLDSDYKNKMFDNNIDKFNEYITKRKVQLENMMFAQSSQSNDKYYIKDNYNYNYILKKSDNEYYNYTIMLDNYTIMDEQILQRYNSLDDYSKAYACAEIFVNMINTKDYNNAYNKTSFDSMQEFENYISSNFFENNIIEAQSVEEKENIYIVETKIYSNINLQTDVMEKNFIVELKEGANFTISFNI